MKNIFSSKSSEYLTNEMCICIDDLNHKILSNIPGNYMFFKNLVDFMMDIEVPYEYEVNILRSYNNTKNREFINKQFYNFLATNGLNEESKEHFIFDNIRHAFINFKQGGVLNMYQYREAEVWYPKIIINKFIGSKDDISELDNEITIYRGTSKEEFISGKFGQSWSINKKVAFEFAYVHYKSHENYLGTSRVLLETKVKKELIYYFDKNGREQEVIVDSKKLLFDKIEILEEKLLSNEVIEI